MIGIEKTTVRAIITLPESTAKVQRLYDYGAWFNLKEETINNVTDVLELIWNLKDRGATMTKHWTYISDDDLKEHECVVYELTC